MKESEKKKIVTAANPTTVTIALNVNEQSTILNKEEILAWIKRKL